MDPSIKRMIVFLSVCAVILVSGTVWAIINHNKVSIPLDLSEESINGKRISPQAEVQQRYRLSDYSPAKSADELISRSDSVFRISVNPGTELVGYYFLSSADVISVLWGEAPKDERIYIYESAALHADPTYSDIPGSIYLYGVTNKLVPGNEYVVCLKKLDFAEGSFSPEHDGRVYIYTDEIMSAFPYGREPVYRELTVAQTSDAYKEGKPIVYEDVKSADYLSTPLLLRQAEELYRSMGERFGTDAFGLPKDTFDPKPEQTPEPTDEPGPIPEPGTIEWLAAELMRIRYLGFIRHNAEDYSEILERNRDTSLFIGANSLEVALAELDRGKYLAEIGRITASIVQIVGETNKTVTADVCVKTELKWSNEAETITAENVFRITVDKEKMKITAYEEPYTPESLYNAYLKPASERYRKTMPWEQADLEAYFEVFELLAAVED